MKLKNSMRPIHPGEILREDYQRELGFTASSLARAMGVSTPTVNNILLERVGVSADMALRLAACLGTTPAFWLNLQTTFALRTAEVEHGHEVASVVRSLRVS